MSVVFSCNVTSMAVDDIPVYYIKFNL